ncbi:hypothetical protein SKAU_G00259990 [Synaphobranchus kaupii]|uniref:Uncharacterized protein n=1 Tax=Synaphobranchus kaupii TaxID=118154 RepID=A0A9Q1IQM6_SYNKA|nr:hypothetical protein SKAU_G00259990 [Synaphobranchus kaupii]
MHLSPFPCHALPFTCSPLPPHSLYLQCYSSCHSNTPVMSSPWASEGCPLPLCPPLLVFFPFLIFLSTLSSLSAVSHLPRQSHSPEFWANRCFSSPKGSPLKTERLKPIRHSTVQFLQCDSLENPTCFQSF